MRNRLYRFLAYLIVEHNNKVLAAAEVFNHNYNGMSGSVSLKITGFF